jgi:hypothetical protein
MLLFTKYAFYVYLQSMLPYTNRSNSCIAAQPRCTIANPCASAGSKQHLRYILLRICSSQLTLRDGSSRIDLLVLWCTLSKLFLQCHISLKEALFTLYLANAALLVCGFSPNRDFSRYFLNISFSRLEAILWQWAGDDGGGGGRAASCFAC